MQISSYPQTNKFVIKCMLNYNYTQYVLHLIYFIGWKFTIF